MPPKAPRGPQLPSETPDWELLKKQKSSLSLDHIAEIAELASQYLQPEAAEFSEEDLLSHLESLYKISQQQPAKMSKKHAKQLEKIIISVSGMPHLHFPKPMAKIMEYANRRHSSRNEVGTEGIMKIKENEKTLDNTKEEQRKEKEKAKSASMAAIKKRFLDKTNPIDEWKKEKYAETLEKLGLPKTDENIRELDNFNRDFDRQTKGRLSEYERISEMSYRSGLRKKYFSDYEKLYPDQIAEKERELSEKKLALAMDVLLACKGAIGENASLHSVSSGFLSNLKKLARHDERANKEGNRHISCGFVLSAFVKCGGAIHSWQEITDAFRLLEDFGLRWGYRLSYSSALEDRRRDLLSKLSVSEEKIHSIADLRRITGLFPKEPEFTVIEKFKIGARSKILHLREQEKRHKFYDAGRLGLKPGASNFSELKMDNQLIFACRNLIHSDEDLRKVSIELGQLTRNYGKSIPKKSRRLSRYIGHMRDALVICENAIRTFEDLRKIWGILEEADIYNPKGEGLQSGGLSGFNEYFKWAKKIINSPEDLRLCLGQCKLISQISRDSYSSPRNDVLKVLKEKVETAKDLKLWMRIFAALGSNGKSLYDAADAMRWLSRIVFSTRQLEALANLIETAGEPDNIRPISVAIAKCGKLISKVGYINALSELVRETKGSVEPARAVAWANAISHLVEKPSDILALMGQILEMERISKLAKGAKDDGLVQGSAEYQKMFLPLKNRGQLALFLKAVERNASEQTNLWALGQLGLPGMIAARPAMLAQGMGESEFDGIVDLTLKSLRNQNIYRYASSDWKTILTSIAEIKNHLLKDMEANFIAYHVKNGDTESLAKNRWSQSGYGSDLDERVVGGLLSLAPNLPDFERYASMLLREDPGAFASDFLRMYRNGDAWNGGHPQYYKASELLRHYLVSSEYSRLAGEFKVKFGLPHDMYSEYPKKYTIASLDKAEHPWLEIAKMRELLDAAVLRHERCAGMMEKALRKSRRKRFGGQEELRNSIMKNLPKRMNEGDGRLIIRALDRLSLYEVHDPNQIIADFKSVASTEAGYDYLDLLEIVSPLREGGGKDLETAAGILEPLLGHGHSQNLRDLNACLREKGSPVEVVSKSIELLPKLESLLALGDREAYERTKGMLMHMGANSHAGMGLFTGQNLGLLYELARINSVQDFTRNKGILTQLTQLTSIDSDSKITLLNNTLLHREAIQPYFDYFSAASKDGKLEESFLLVYSLPESISSILLEDVGRNGYGAVEKDYSEVSGFLNHSQTPVWRKNAKDFLFAVLSNKDFTVKDFDPELKNAGVWLVQAHMDASQEKESEFFFTSHTINHFATVFPQSLAGINAIAEANFHPAVSLGLLALKPDWQPSQVEGLKKLLPRSGEISKDKYSRAVFLSFIQDKPEVQKQVLAHLASNGVRSRNDQELLQLMSFAHVVGQPFADEFMKQDFHNMSDALRLSRVSVVDALSAKYPKDALENCTTKDLNRWLRVFPEYEQTMAIHHDEYLIPAMRVHATVELLGKAKEFYERDEKLLAELMSESYFPLESERKQIAEFLSKWKSMQDEKEIFGIKTDAQAIRQARQWKKPLKVEHILEEISVLDKLAEAEGKLDDIFYKNHFSDEFSRIAGLYDGAPTIGQLADRYKQMKAEGASKEELDSIRLQQDDVRKWSKLQSVFINYQKNFEEIENGILAAGKGLAPYADIMSGWGFDYGDSFGNKVFLGELKMLSARCETELKAHPDDARLQEFTEKVKAMSLACQNAEDYIATLANDLEPKKEGKAGILGGLRAKRDWSQELLNQMNEGKISFEGAMEKVKKEQSQLFTLIDASKEKTDDAVLKDLFLRYTETTAIADLESIVSLARKEESQQNKVYVYFNQPIFSEMELALVGQCLDYRYSKNSIGNAPFTVSYMDSFRQMVVAYSADDTNLEHPRVDGLIYVARVTGQDGGQNAAVLIDTVYCPDGTPMSWSKMEGQVRFAMEKAKEMNLPLVLPSFLESYYAQIGEWAAAEGFSAKQEKVSVEIRPGPAGATYCEISSYNHYQSITQIEKNAMILEMK